MRGVGHAERSESKPEEAIGIARDPNRLTPGMPVRVAPDDHGFDSFEGEIVASKLQAIAIRREAPEVGDVIIHFPRAGFRVTRV